jgi:hypothetical protein
MPSANADRALSLPRVCTSEVPPPVSLKSTRELGLVGDGSGRLAALPRCMEGDSGTMTLGGHVAAERRASPTVAVSASWECVSG